MHIQFVKKEDINRIDSKAYLRKTIDYMCLAAINKIENDRGNRRVTYSSVVVQFFKVLHLWIGATMRCYLASRSQHSDLTFHQALLTFTTLSIHVSTPTLE